MTAVERSTSVVWSILLIGQVQGNDFSEQSNEIINAHWRIPFKSKNVHDDGSSLQFHDWISSNATATGNKS